MKAILDLLLEIGTVQPDGSVVIPAVVMEILKPQVQTRYAWGPQWPGQEEKRDHPFYNSSSFSSAHSLYKSMHKVHERHQFHSYQWLRGHGLVAGSIKPITWPEVIIAANNEQMFRTTITFAKGKFDTCIEEIPCELCE